MLFYKVNREAHDYLTGNTAVKDELVTQKERDTKFRYLKDDIFSVVFVPKQKTFWNFGCRFECKE